MYKKHELYSDQLFRESIISNLDYEDLFQISKGAVTKKIKSSYGTRHILVFVDFPMSTKIAKVNNLLDEMLEKE